jgi:hypothetical protein
MKFVLMIGGAILLALGLVWILQGVNILPGSFMTGHIVWAWYGAACMVVGLLVVLWARRRR